MSSTKDNLKRARELVSKMPLWQREVTLTKYSHEAMKERTKDG